MNAPTDTWLQTILQSAPEGALVWIIAIAVMSTISIALIIGMVVEARDIKRKRRTFHSMIKGGQRNERKPAHWGHYR